MLSVAVQKRYRRVSAQNRRQDDHAHPGIHHGCAFVSVLAGLYIYFVLGLNVSDCTYFIYAVSLPFWCVGFVKPCGMPFEQFAPLWLKANFTNDRIFYKPSMRLAGLLSESENSKQKRTIYGKHYRKQGNLRGIESYSPRAGRVIS